MPSPQSMHVDSVLTGISRKYTNGTFVANQILPYYNVQKLSDVYYIYNRTGFWTVPDATHGPKSEAKTIDWDVSTGVYACLPYALKDYVSFYDRKNADAPIDPEADTVEFLREKQMLVLEDKVGTLLTTTGTYSGNTTTLTGNDQWGSGTASATPVADIRAAMAACVTRPNTMLIGQEVWDVLIEDATLIDKIKYTSPGVISEDIVAKVFGLDKIIVASAQKSSTAGVLSYIWGKNVILALVKRPGPKTAQFGVTFSALGENVVRRYPAPQIGGGSDAIEVNWAVDPRVTCTDLGYLIKNAVA